MDLDFNKTDSVASNAPATPDVGSPPPMPEASTSPAGPVPSVAGPVASAGTNAPLTPLNSTAPTEPVSPLPGDNGDVNSDIDSTPPDKKRSLLLPIILIILVLIVAIALAWYFLIKGQNKSASTTSTVLSTSTTDTTFPNSTTTTPTSTTSTTTTTPSTTSTTTTTNTPAARDAQRKADLATIKNNLDTYFSTNNAYPVAADIVKTSDTSSVIVSALASTTLPDDPLAPLYYYGYKSSDGKSYELTARLEDTTDPAGILVGSYYLYKVTNTSSVSDSSSTLPIGTDFSSTSTTTTSQ